MRMLSFRRFTILLLASSASSIAAGNASAAPFNPVGLSPAVLFPVTDSATAALVRSVEGQTPNAMFGNLNFPAELTGPLDTQVRSLLASDFQVGNGVSNGAGAAAFTNSDISQPAITVRRTQLALRPTLDATFDNLSRSPHFGLPPSHAVNSGVDANLFDGRLQISSDLTVANDTMPPLGLRLGEDWRSAEETDVAYRHSFAAKVIDRARFKWSLAGQMGQIDPRFADFIFTQPGDKSPALRWSQLSTRMDLGIASLSVAYDDVTRQDQVETHRSLTFGFNKSALSVYQREASQFSLDQGGRWMRRTAVTGVSADVIVADVLPHKVAEIISPIAPFLPNTVSASFEEGDGLQPDSIGSLTPVERVRSMSLDLTWDTQLGQTTASLWQRDTKANVDDISLQRTSDRVVDIAHSITRGNWRFGAGVSLIQSSDETPLTHSRETRVAPHVSFAYSSKDFPTVEVRVGAADARTIVGVDDIPASAKARQLQVSLDLSNFVQDQLGRPEAKLKLEYRRQLDKTDDPSVPSARQGDQALLLTFSTPLN